MTKSKDQQKIGVLQCQFPKSSFVTHYKFKCCRSQKSHPVGFEQRSHKKEMEIIQYFFENGKMFIPMIDK